MNEAWYLFQTTIKITMCTKHLKRLFRFMNLEKMNDKIMKRRFQIFQKEKKKFNETFDQHFEWFLKNAHEKYKSFNSKFKISKKRSIFENSYESFESSKKLRAARKVDTSKKIKNLLEKKEKNNENDSSEMIIKNYWNICDENESCSKFFDEKLRAVMMIIQSHILIKAVCLYYAVYLNDSNLCEVHRKTMMNIFNFVSKQSFEILKTRAAKLINHQRNLVNFVTSNIYEKWFNDDLMIFDSVRLIDRK